MPLIGSTITPIVVFLPLISITGVTGAFFRALAITVGTALLTSLALALTWTPTLSHYFLGTPHGERRIRTATLTSTTAACRRGSCSATSATLRLAHRAARLLLVVGSAAGRWPPRTAAIALLGSDLLPEMDEGGFILDYIMPAGSSLDETNQVMTGVEQILRATPEVESTSRRTGLQLGLAAVTEANTGDIAVKLKRKRDRGVATK